MTAAQISAQAAWLEADLSAVNRSATPWVAAYSHKAYMMDQTTWGLFDFLATYNVDVQFVGHWHQVCRRAFDALLSLGGMHNFDRLPCTLQYTRYPPIDSRNGTVVIDKAAVSADKRTYTDAKYPTVIVTGVCACLFVRSTTRVVVT